MYHQEKFNKAICCVRELQQADALRSWAIRDIAAHPAIAPMITEIAREYSCARDVTGPTGCEVEEMARFQLVVFIQQPRIAPSITELIAIAERRLHRRVNSQYYREARERPLHVRGHPRMQRLYGDAIVAGPDGRARQVRSHRKGGPKAMELEFSCEELIDLCDRQRSCD